MNYSNLNSLLRKLNEEKERMHERIAIEALKKLNHWARQKNRIRNARLLLALKNKNKRIKKK